MRRCPSRLRRRPRRPGRRPAGSRPGPRDGTCAYRSCGPLPYESFPDPGDPDNVSSTVQRVARVVKDTFSRRSPTLYIVWFVQYSPDSMATFPETRGRRPTMKDVASVAKVGLATVSRVLN